MNSVLRTVVIGAAGQLGRELCHRLPGEVSPLVRADADLTDFSVIQRKLVNLRPHVVINCAAYNLVDKAEEDFNLPFLVNGFALRVLAETCESLDAKLVHFSTDY